MSVYKILIYSDMLLFIILIIFSLVNFKIVVKRKYFFFFFIIAGIMQLVSIVTSALVIRNTFIMPIYVFALISGLGGYYYYLLKNDKNKMWLGAIWIGLFVLLLSELMKQLQHGALDLTWYSHFCVSVLLALASFIIMVLKPDAIKHRGEFLIHIAVFLYSSVGALVFLFGNILMKMPFQAQMSIWTIHTAVHLIFLILIGRSLWMMSRS